MIAGAMTIDNPIKIKVSKRHAESYLSKLLEIMESAQANKPASILLANKISTVFVSAAIAMAACTFFYWFNINPDVAFKNALSVLVITCPCAFSLATPAVITVLINTLARYNILVTHAEAIDKLNEVTDVIFDKTGTLTLGEFSVVQCENHSTLSNSELWKIIYLLEQSSEHPIARALTRHAAKQTTIDAESTQSTTVTHREHTIGKGIQGTLNGEQYLIGNAAFTQSQTDSPHQDSASTYIHLSTHQQPLATIELTDTLRPQAQTVVNYLKSRGLTTHIISGDAIETTTSMANQLDILHAQGRCLPDEKLDYVNQIQKTGKRALVIGDGVNDAPILAAGSVSMAMGEGTDLAKSAADIILTNNDIGLTVLLINLQQKATRIIRQNIVWAISYNVLALPFAVMGYIPPYMAAIGMSFSSLLVTLNALRLKKQKAVTSQPTSNRDNSTQTQ